MLQKVAQKRLPAERDAPKGSPKRTPLKSCKNAVRKTDEGKPGTLLYQVIRVSLWAWGNDSLLHLLPLPRQIDGYVVCTKFVPTKYVASKQIPKMGSWGTVGHLPTCRQEAIPYQVMDWKYMQEERQQTRRPLPFPFSLPSPHPALPHDHFKRFRLLS